MTDEDFRRLVLAQPGAVEGSHHNHPDFRLEGNIFATLGPDGTWVTVRLAPEQQETFLKEAPGVFEPAAGAWGRQGMTVIQLAKAKKTLVKKAIETAWHLASLKPPARKKK
ncbi:MAG: MmcQ/YjbR family DNA-binding protein [Planctomycetota bacterium]